MTDYQFSRALLVRSMGMLLAVIGASIFVLAALVAALDLSGLVLQAAVLIGLVLVLVASLALSRFRTLIRFDDDGYSVRLLRGAGVRQARWREVEDAVTAVAAGQDCVVLRLRDGRTTTIPVKVLDVSPQVFIDDLRGRLDRGRGYRRLR